MALEVGALLDGKVTGIMEYGAFVDIGEGKNGMVHISEIAKTYVANIREHLTVGQAVTVKVLSVSAEGKVSLSIKKALPEEEDRPAPRKSSPPPNVWQGQRAKTAPGEPASFEDMMSKFKSTSEEKISTLRKSGDNRYGGNTKGKRK